MSVNGHFEADRDLSLIGVLAENIELKQRNRGDGIAGITLTCSAGIGGGIRRFLYSRQNVIPGREDEMRSEDDNLITGFLAARTDQLE